MKNDWMPVRFARGSGWVHGLSNAWRVIAVAFIGSLMMIGQAALAGVVNGGFESAPDFAGWTKQSYNLQAGGITTFPPTQKSDLNLSAPVLAFDLSAVLRGAPESLSDANTNGLLKFPRWGNAVARVHNQFGAAPGTAQDKASSIEQTATMTLADVDPTDGKIHLRFAAAPVLRAPAHADNLQPYFFIEVTNVTKGTKLFTTFNFSNQPGIPWQSGVGDYKFTDWQGFDIAPGNGFLDVGDSVKMEVIVAGCQPSGHEGHLYLDSVGAFIQGLAVTTVGPTTARPGDQITYTYTYTNNSGVISSNTTVTAVMPKTGNDLDTTFVSIQPNGGTCTLPTVGTADAPVVCNFGTLNNGASGSFTVTVTIPPASSTASPTNVVNNGNYKVASDGTSAFLGPLFQTQVMPLASPLTDLGITISDGGVSAVAPGSTVTYTVVVTNNGPTAVVSAPVSQTLSGLSGVTWACAAGAGAACGAPVGANAIVDAPSLPVGASVTYTVTGTAGAAGTTTATTVSVAAPGGITDSNTANNAAADTNAVGTLYAVGVSKSGAGSGSVSSVPSGLSCGAACASASVSVANGTTTILSAVAAPGSIFTGWSGAGCSGTGTCTVNVSGANANVIANFALTRTVTPVVGANGTVTPATPTTVASGSSVTYTINPDPTYAPLITGNCPGVLSGNQYTVSPVNADCTFNVAFTNATATVTSSVNGGNGGISPAGAQTVALGSQQTFTLTPVAGYVARVATGGTACPGSLVGNTFTTNAIAGSCTVVASFVLSAGVSSVPTLSEWGLIVLSLVLAALGLRRLPVGRRPTH
ncbi:putative secreted protein (IPTL-CTERM system target) [Acidovorax sp. 69]|uniref:IPTL-CTERM sorting domain-containing protein n=1 Tax=Acidovorax sp. 69 TaxID=2035202 RepID=UPI000C251392|nr:IPTL-CTERM sorting domain-containing protein [Acidovorax sp. 69]PJI96653.1 putative secreted protein (IPTL-CTERM system target) [Acidovorax sp. 69]